MFTVMRLPYSLFLVLCCLAFAVPVTLADERPWTLSGALRLRGEMLEDSFRLRAPARDELLLTRLEAALRYRGELLEGQFEIQDSRAFNDKPLSPLGTDDVNALEPILAWLGARWMLGDGELAARAGRMTLDFGSRRLLARNRFRNTSNAFQGGLLRWEKDSAAFQGFYFLPLQRAPGALERDALRTNEAALDRAGSAERFAGLTASWTLAESISAEAYLFDSRVRTQPLRPRNAHDLLTLGGRLQWSRGPWRGEGELAVQWGESRPLLAAEAAWQTHRAWTGHGSIGRRFGESLELSIAYDVASGDRDPDDGRYQRFDRLYGARAFELGPSGIFGVAVRSNLRSLGLRLEAEPAPNHLLLLSLRQLRLDSGTDALVGSGRRDLSGAAGRDIGLQWELRWRWSPAPWTLEAGIALLDPGRYFEGGTPLNPTLDASLSRYAFTQLSWRF
jgi:hypothetical protein